MLCIPQNAEMPTAEPMQLSRVSHSLSHTKPVLAWLDRSIRPGFGERFVAAFDDYGVEEEADLILLDDEDIDAIDVLLISTCGAKKFHRKAIRQAIDSHRFTMSRLGQAPRPIRIMPSEDDDAGAPSVSSAETRCASPMPFDSVCAELDQVDRGPMPLTRAEDAPPDAGEESDRRSASTEQDATSKDLDGSVDESDIMVLSVVAVTRLTQQPLVLPSTCEECQVKSGADEEVEEMEIEVEVEVEEEEDDDDVEDEESDDDDNGNDEGCRPGARLLAVSFEASSELRSAIRDEATAACEDAPEDAPSTLAAMTPAATPPAAVVTTNETVHQGPSATPSGQGKAEDIAPGGGDRVELMEVRYPVVGTAGAWYPVELLCSEAGRYKVLHAGDGPTEWVAAANTRPRPPVTAAWAAPEAERLLHYADWTAKIRRGDLLDMAFEGGWWQVRLVERLASNRGVGPDACARGARFRVRAELYNVVHEVSADQLRPHWERTQLGEWCYTLQRTCRPLMSWEALLARERAIWVQRTVPCGLFGCPLLRPGGYPHPGLCMPPEGGVGMRESRPVEHYNPADDGGRLTSETAEDSRVHRSTIWRRVQGLLSQGWSVEDAKKAARELGDGRGRCRGIAHGKAERAAKRRAPPSAGRSAQRYAKRCKAVDGGREPLHGMAAADGSSAAAGSDLGCANGSGFRAGPPASLQVEHSSSSEDEDLDDLPLCAWLPLVTRR